MGNRQQGAPTVLEGGQSLRVWGIRDLVTSRLVEGAQGHGQDVLRAKALEYSPHSLGRSPWKTIPAPPPTPSAL